MANAVLFALLKQQASSKRALKARVERKRLACKRRMKNFAQKRSRERICFVFTMSMLALSLHTTSVRTLWAKERSSYWWDHIVKHTFSCHDWLENFRMSEATFLFLCNELRSNIEKTDTVMRDAIAVERRVALTLWFLATNSDYVGTLNPVTVTCVSRACFNADLFWCVCVFV